MPFNPSAAARYLFDAHQSRADYRNLPSELTPPSISAAYAAQDALAALLTPTEGAVAGLKVATTTRVMQDLMGIDHPCAGLIFAHRILRSPSELALSRFVHVMIECELALRLGTSLPKAAQPHTAESVAGAVAEVMPAFELIEDRNAHYKSTQATSMIADNCWNAGIVIGAGSPLRDPGALVGCRGRLTVNGREPREGRTEDPFATLAWLANVAVERGRLLEAGMVVITGSVLPTLPITAGDLFVFELDGVGSVELAARA